METVDIAHAKEHLEELIARATTSEELRIAQQGVGTVRLAAIEGQPGSRPERRPGRWKGRLNVPDEALLAPLSDEELRDWYGERD